MKAIDVRFFNVGHGDSILLEAYDESRRTDAQYIVIDSSMTSTKSGLAHPCVDYLKSRSVKKILALVVTHLHRDHCQGIEQLLDGSFEIDTTVIPPLFSTKTKVLEEAFDKCKRDVEEALKGTDSESLRSQYRSIAWFLAYLAKNEESLMARQGPMNVLPFLQSTGATLYACLPLRRTKGTLYTHMTRGGLFCEETMQTMNDMSIALLIDFHGNRCLLTGDAPAAQWRTHRHEMRAEPSGALKCRFLKSPHHGSEHDNEPFFFDYARTPNQDEPSYCFVSGKGGAKQPHASTLKTAAANGFSPRCTNLADACFVHVPQMLSNLRRLPEEARPFVLHYGISGPNIPCQGSMILTLKEDGTHSVSSETNRPCVYS